LLPENVFIATFGEVLLGEVGVSTVASALEPFRSLPRIAAYRAPEQLGAGPSPSISESADVFSVGVVLWELLANRPLFGDPERLGFESPTSSAAAAMRTLEDVQSKLIPTLGTTDRAGAPVSRAAAEVVEHALRRDPATRYATMEQMLDALLALGSEVVASCDQVAAALERLARPEVEAQRTSLQPMSGSFPASRPGTPPDSGRPTHRPPPPVAKTSRPPEDDLDAQWPKVEEFSQDELPTWPTVPPLRS
jgi:serine/threonine-protein kinase